MGVLNSIDLLRSIRVRVQISNKKLGTREILQFRDSLQLLPLRTSLCPDRIAIKLLLSSTCTSGSRRL